MQTDPLTGSRYPESSDDTNLSQWFKNAVTDLSDNTIPRFTTTTARDTAYSAWVTGGGTMTSGLFCAVAGVIQEYDGSTWGAPLLYGIRLQRSSTVSVSNNFPENQGFNSGHIVSDRGGYYNGVGADIMKVPAGMAGLYLVSIGSTMVAPVLNRHLGIITDGVAGNELFRANGAYNDSAHASAPIWLAAGATIGVKLYQASGAALNNIALSVSILLIGR